MSVQASIN